MQLPFVQNAKYIILEQHYIELYTLYPKRQIPKAVCYI